MKEQRKQVSAALSFVRISMPVFMNKKILSWGKSTDAIGQLHSLTAPLKNIFSWQTDEHRQLQQLSFFRN